MNAMIFAKLNLFNTLLIQGSGPGGNGTGPGIGGGLSRDVDSSILLLVGAALIVGATYVYLRSRKLKNA